MLSHFLGDRLRDRVDDKLTAEVIDQIVDAVEEGVIVADLDGTVLAWNRAAERLYGYRADEIIGQHVSLLPPPERAHEPMDSIRRIGQGEPTVTRDTVRQRKDGSRVECKVTVKPVHEVGNGLVGVCAIVRDQTDTNQIVRRLSEREFQLAGLLEQAVSGVVILSRDGLIEYINAGFSRLFGYDPAAVVGHSMLDYVLEADRATVIEGVSRAFSGHSPSVEARVIASDGTVRTVIGQSTSVPYEGQLAVLSVVIDVSDQMATASALKRSNRLLRTIGAANEALVRADTERGLMEAMCQLLVNTAEMRSASIALVTDDRRLNLAATSHHEDEESCQSLALDGAALGDAWNRVAQVVDEGTARFEMASGSVWLPLAHAGATFGCLYLESSAEDPLEDDERTLLNELADDLAYGLTAIRQRVERAQGATRLRRSMEEVIAALAATVELRDPYTAGHQRHVAELATAIAGELGMDGSTVASIRLAAVIHDIGKIKIPTELLTRPGSLTDIEEQLLQTHATAGYEILKGIDFPWPIAEIVWQHHERLDGSGYPRGLQADAILPEARVLAVADLVEAMSADRPYRFGKGIPAALAIIEEGRGVQFDARVVDACLTLFRESRFAFSDSLGHRHHPERQSSVSQ